MSHKKLNEIDRLRLIAEAIRYCKTVKEMGMPASCYSKALREPIHFLWERRSSSKFEAASYASRAALDAKESGEKIIYDHAIPFIYLQSILLDFNSPSLQTIKGILLDYSVITLITKSEDNKLNRVGLRSKMPQDWDGKNPLARYASVEIEILKIERSF